MVYNRMGLGWINATARFQTYMHRILGDLIARGVVLCYLDDILILSKDESQHAAILKEVLARLSAEGLVINPDKCDFYKTKITFLGMVCDGKTVSVPSENLEAIRNLRTPSNLKELQMAMGLLNYYRHFIEHFAHLSAILYTLTTPKTQVAKLWRPEHQAAFDKLKSTLADSCTLHVRQTEGAIIVRTDASDVGYGGVIEQEQNKRFVPLAFFSSTALVKSKWVGEQECLAFAFTMKKAYKLLAGASFTWECDHANLVKMDPSVRSEVVQQVAHDLLGFDYTFAHIRGSTNVVADALSRILWPTPPRLNIYAFVGYTPTPQLASFAVTLRGRATGPAASSSDTQALYDATLEEALKAHQKAPKAKPSARPPTSPTAPSPSNSSSNSTSSSDQSSGASAAISPHTLPADPLLSRILQENIASPLLDAIIDAQEAYLHTIDTSGPKWTHETTTCQRGNRMLAKHDGALYVPQQATSLHQRILSWQHNTTSHFAASTFIKSLQHHVKIYWPSMHKDAALFVSKCPTCIIIHDPNPSGPRTFLHPRPPHEMPHQRIIGDILGPLATDDIDLGSTYVLVIVDSLTHFAWAYPICPHASAPDANEIKERLQRHFTFWGIPVEFQSDGGPNLSNATLSAFATELGYTHHVTTPRHPQSNGLAEVMMRIIAIALRSHTGTRVETWEQFLDISMRDINNRHHKVLQMSPYKALMGFDQSTAVTRALSGSSLPGFPIAAADYADAIKDFHGVLTQHFFDARSRTIAEQSTRAARHATHVRKPVSFTKGQMVLYRENSTPHKLLSSENPVAFEILEALPFDKYKIQSIISAHSRFAHGENLRATGL